MQKILIVEDEEAIANLIKINLSAEGYRCTCAYDGKTGADYIERETFDLILLDIMLPEIDFERIGQRVKQARIDKGYTQAELGEVIGCSNNHMSHIETGQTKVSLSLLLKLAYALDMDLNFFLMDTPYVEKDRMIDSEIANKLSQCSPSTLLSVNKIIDVLLEQQEREKDSISY